MTTSIRDINNGPGRIRGSAWRAGGATCWPQHREATLNWLALGLLLAAWNASDDPAQRRLRPEALRRYCAVSVRAAAHHCATIGAPSAR
ncbi:MAG: hypothetical protein ACYDAH_10805 [Steroidobacteraceae bacterium]